MPSDLIAFAIWVGIFLLFTIMIMASLMVVPEEENHPTMYPFP